MTKERVAAFVDGFNLYHAIDDLRQPHLKWVDRWALSEVFVKRRSQALEDVFYFSAFAYWLPHAMRRHKAYVSALVAHRVTPVMANFKEKDRRCKACGAQWVGHEEKETDVNMALAMLDGAYRNSYDHAFLVSRDSDLAPVVRILRARFPDKSITLIAPPNRGHSSELLAAVPPPMKAKIKVKHLERCLLPQVVQDAGGNVAAMRPSSYDPPRA